MNGDTIIHKRSELAAAIGYTYDGVRSFERKADFPGYPNTLDRLNAWRDTQRPYHRHRGMKESLAMMASRLKSARNAKNWSQRTLAREAECDVESISNYECGRVRPKPERMERIAKALGITLAWIMKGEANG